MIFLLIATIFQSSAQKSAIKRLNRKENAFALGTLDFTQINQARKCNFLCLSILQSEHVKKFVFTIRPFFFLLTGHRRETRRGPSWPVRPAGEGLWPARDARGRPAGGAAGPAMASQSHAQPWARPAEAAGGLVAAEGNADDRVLC